MKSPKDMIVIQIDITNACIHQCSNCTRFCGHHKKPFYMDFETFKRAVHSLDGYVGVVGLMGGEPTLHPDFTKMVEYLSSHRMPMGENHMEMPQTDLMDAVHDLEYSNTYKYPMSDGYRSAINGAGLWTTNVEGYKRFYEVIQDNIKYQMINDHSNPMYHQPILISRRSLGIDDRKWEELRDNCWLQNTWSATITPKGAFFCEVAGALDMLFEGPGGWKIEPGWWQRTPEDFGEQLRWCEMCGIACDTFTRDANEAKDDVSADIYEMLKKIHSPKAEKGRINIIKVSDSGEIEEESKAAEKVWDNKRHPYTDSYDSRFDVSRNNFFSKKLIGIFICDNESSIEHLKKNIKKVEESYVLAPAHIYGRIKECLEDTDNIHIYDNSEKNLGTLCYLAVGNSDYKTYSFILSGDIEISEYLMERLNRLVLNPGTLLFKEIREDNKYFRGKEGSAALLNGHAKAIAELGWDRIVRFDKIEEFRAGWITEKIIAFDPSMERSAPTDRIKRGERCVLYGAGKKCQNAIEYVKKAGGIVVAIIDSDKRKWGSSIDGIKVGSIGILDDRKAFDRVMISTTYYYREIKNEVMAHGIKESEIALV